METTTLISIFSLALAVPQGAAAIAFLWDWAGKGRSRAVKMTFLRSFLTVLLVVGAVACGIFGTWLIYHPIKPTQTIVYVDRPVPCPTPPPTGSGNATTHGSQSPANSGGGNSTSYGGTSGVPDKSKPQ